MTNSKQSITTSLFDQAFSKKALLNAWNALNKSNPTSHGIDEETIAEFRDKHESRINQLSKKLLSKQFKFSPVRGVLIRKDNGKHRPLRISIIEDRIAIKSIAIVVEEQISSKFEGLEKISFAYQKGKGIKDALKTIVEHHRAGCLFLIKCDIVDFFGTVNREKLFIDALFPLLEDATLNDYIASALDQPVQLDKIKEELKYYFKNSEAGIPQGNALSPLLSNLYLNSLDKLFLQQNVKLVRYADDFVLMGETKEEVTVAFDRCRTYLSEIGLLLHPLDHPNSKSQFIQIGVNSFSFLSIGYDGVDLYPSEASIEKFKNKIAEISRKSPNLLDGLLTTNNTIQGWIASYEFTNLPKYYKELNIWIGYRIHTLLTRLNIALKHKSARKDKVQGKNGKLKNVNVVNHKSLLSLGVIDVEQTHKSKKK